MRSRAYIEVEDKILIDRMNRLEKSLDSKSKVTVDEVAEWTKLKAKILAPKWTGETARFIISAPRVNRKGYHEAVVGFKENPHPEKEPFNLPLWMHYSPDAKDYPWRNGKNPKFLFASALEARIKFFRKVDTMIRESINGR
jgi:hypothetical protein